MAESTAWLLPLNNGWNVAIGEREMVHLVDEPELFEVPESPYYCRRAIVWQGEVLPVMDIVSWLEGNTEVELEKDKQYIVAVTAYQEHEGALPQYGGLLLEAIPVRKPVNDQQACALPEPQDNWSALAISCFSDNGRATPILNLPVIFANREQAA